MSQVNSFHYIPKVEKSELLLCRTLIVFEIRIDDYL